MANDSRNVAILNKNINKTTFFIFENIYRACNKRFTSLLQVFNQTFYKLFCIRKNCVCTFYRKVNFFRKNLIEKIGKLIF